MGAPSSLGEIERMREYRTIRALERGETVELWGLRFVKDQGEIGKGDLYIAERNTGPQLLTCAYVNHENGYVVPSEGEYPYDLSECVKVRESQEGK